MLRARLFVDGCSVGVFCGWRDLMIDIVVNIDMHGVACLLHVRCVMCLFVFSVLGVDLTCVVVVASLCLILWCVALRCYDVGTAVDCLLCYVLTILVCSSLH